MMTLYTAIGTYKLNTHGLPTVISGDKEYGLSAHELLLWTCLSFRILTYRELRAEFYEKERELHILGELDFDHYLNKLIMRRLVVTGKDCTGADALYDLLGHLHVQSIPNSFFVKAATFAKLILFRGISIGKAASVFHTVKLEPMEKRVLSLVRNQTLSTAELILCTENGKTTLKNADELMDCLYSNKESDCETIVTDGRVCETRFPVLSAIANLYLKQCITFQIV